MKKRKTYTGWIAKRAMEKLPPKWHGFSLPVYRLRGKCADWNPADWPPVKVRVTVEVVKERGKFIVIPFGK
ncbi:MAG TPA: hypothetical protein VMW36_08735 [Patescibacteria group bacterium]|nr:hypothetical protein [Patescibacteria group bacterium]